MKSGWNFDNSYSRLPDAFFTSTNPTPVKDPNIVILNEPLAKSLGLNVEALQSQAPVFGGNEIPEGASPLAQAYAGHQFGNFTMLGDGRAILLGEHITPTGHRVDIQLKGSGRTQYSRSGDGRAALGPMLREYIISEAMHALNIPTTRSLAVVTTGEGTIRETILPGAILTRVAASHIRVGTFQYAAAARPVQELKELADYTIKRHYPAIDDQTQNRYQQFLQEVVKRQADLIAKWQLVGFIHGVMNTDNMTISGETIDYGPCAFMDTFNPETVFSSIDTQGRYAYKNQPRIAVWNLARFAESLLPLLHEDDDQAVQIAQDTISKFNDYYNANWIKGMRAKLGLFTEEPQDEALIYKLLQLMEENQADYTNTFRSLTLGELKDSPLFGKPEFDEWMNEWQVRLNQQPQSKEEVAELMRANNPAVIPRNHRVEEALDAAVEGDYNVMHRLLDVLSKPFDYTKDHAEYCSLPEPSNRPYRTFCGT
ncbi:protein adenylyltransferase SelO [Ureibacillus composti]